MALEKGTPTPETPEQRIRRGGRGTAKPPPKPPKPLPVSDDLLQAPGVAPGVLNAETAAPARRSIREAQTRRELRPYVRDRVAKSLERNTIFQGLDSDGQKELQQSITSDYVRTLSQRADMLESGLLKTNPQLAAELLLSPVATQDLRDVSSAALEGYRSLEVQVQQQAAERALAYQEASRIKPEDLTPEQLAKFVKLQLPEDLHHFVDGAFRDIEDEAQRELFLANLIEIGTHPEDERGGDAQYDWEHALSGTLVGTDTSPLQRIASGVGGAFALPFAALGKAGGFITRDVFGADSSADIIGAGARGLEKGIGYTIRVGEGLIAGGLTGTGFDYVPTWSEYEEGKPGPAAQLWFDITGLNPEDYQGIGNVIDMAADVALSEGVLRTAAYEKAARTEPHHTYNGERFVQGPGKDLVKDIERTITDASEGFVRTDLINRYRHMPASLADELSRVGTADDIARTVASYIDEVPRFELPQLRKELKAVKDQLTTTSETASPFQFLPRNRSVADMETLRAIGSDPNYLYHVTNKTVFEQHVQTGGLKANTPQRLPHWEDGGTDPRLFFGGDGAQSITLAPDVDNAAVLMRVSRDSVPELQSGTFAGEFYTASDIAPRFIEYLDSDGVWRTVGSESTSLTSLQARRIAIEQRIIDLQNREVVFHFPSTSRVRAFMRGTPRNTLVGRTLQRVFGETGVADLSKFADDLSPHDSYVFNPRSSRKPHDWATHNVEVLRKEMNIAKVPKVTQNSIIEEMFSLTTRQDVFNWRKRVSRAFEEGLSRGGKRPIVSEVRQEILRFSDDTLEERISSPVTRSATLPDGSTISQVRNSLESLDGHPLPIRPNAFLGDQISLPNVRYLQDAASSIRYFDRWAKTQPWLIKAGYTALRAPTRQIHTLMRLGRLVLRPLTLVSQPVRLWLKIQGDQSLRNFLMGYTRKSWRKNNVDYGPAGLPVNPTLKELLPDGDLTALGSVASEMERLTETVATRMNTRNIDVHPSNPEAVQVVRSRADQIADLFADEAARKMAAYGPDDTLRFLSEHPESNLGRWWDEEMRPLLEENGITPEQWASAFDNEIAQATGNMVELRRAIASGDLETTRPVSSGAAMDRRFILDELDEARAALSTTEEAIARRELSLRIDVLEDRLVRADAADTGPSTVSVGDRDALANEIMENWEVGTYAMPDEVLVRRNVARFDEPLGTSLTDRTLAQAQRLNRTLYQGLRPLSRYDFSRQSTYRVVLDRVYQDLVKRGYGAKDALEIAQRRAAYITKDLHYDISARSSFDRRMQDYFWFSAVWREQLTTYLYKIPSRHYWPIGFGLRTFQAYQVLDAFKAFGLVEWSESQYKDENGELQTTRSLVVNVPWVSDLISKIVDNEEAGQLKIEGINPLTPGTAGLLPQLSTPAEAILDFSANHAPEEMMPFFDLMSGLFTFDHRTDQGPSFLPSPLRTAAEMVGIHIPFDTLSADAWREAERKANVQANTWAMSDLANEGILPPGKDATEAEIASYREKLKERAHYYETTLGILHLVGSTIAPGQFTQRTGVNDAGQDFYDWRETLPEDLEREEFYALQNAYLAEHPEAWPFSVGRHPGTYGTPTYDSTRTLDAEDFIDKALQQVAYWMEKDPDAPDTNLPEGEIEPTREKLGARAVVQWSADGRLSELESEEVDALGLPSFYGRDDLVNTIERINEVFEERYSYELPEARKEALIEERDRLLERAAGRYGREGQEILRWARSTPAERLRRADYFTSGSSQQILDEAQAVTRFAEAQGSSPQFAAESTGVLGAKIELYRSLERLRRVDPAFDREVRRAEIALGEKDTTKGRVALYEWLFFGQPSNAFGYQDTIIRGLR